MVAFLPPPPERAGPAERESPPPTLMKSLAAVDDKGRPTLLLVPGDREARLPAGWRLFEEADFAAHPY